MMCDGGSEVEVEVADHGFGEKKTRKHGMSTDIHASSVSSMFSFISGRIPFYVTDSHVFEDSHSFMLETFYQTRTVKCNRRKISILSELTFQFRLRAHLLMLYMVWREKDQDTCFVNLRQERPLTDDHIID